jgi:hypothetical protein
MARTNLSKLQKGSLKTPKQTTKEKRAKHGKSNFS